jgi:hypothetical protein
VPENVFEQDLDRHRHAAQVGAEGGTRPGVAAGKGRETVDVRQTGSERGPSAEGIADNHDISFAISIERLIARPRRGSAFRQGYAALGDLAAPGDAPTA